jgi:hypothetical protein
MDQAMRPRSRWRALEIIGSMACFALVVGGLFAIDPRVREHVTSEISSHSVSTWGGRLTAAIPVLVEVARSQSIDHAPMVVFGLVAVVLVLFLLRT